MSGSSFSGPTREGEGRGGVGLGLVGWVIGLGGLWCRDFQGHDEDKQHSGISPTGKSLGVGISEKHCQPNGSPGRLDEAELLRKNSHTGDKERGFDTSKATTVAQIHAADWSV